MTRFRYESQAEKVRPRAVLVTVAIGKTPDFDTSEELTELAQSDALEVAGIVRARRDKPDPATLLGSGKVREIADLARSYGADVVIFDATLTAAQERNLVKALG